MNIARPDALAAIKTALARRPIALLTGPRQCGKTTLARKFMDPDALNYFDLEDPSSLARLQEPMTTLSSLTGFVVIDEVQRVPDVLLAIKQRVDQDPSPGQFLLTGSANILTAPRSTPDVFRGRRSPHWSRSVAQQVVSPRAFASIEVCASPGQTEGRARGHI